MTSDPRVQPLLAIWYRVISPIHHKDRDCRFYITRALYCFAEPEWLLEHAGYLIHDRPDVEHFATYEAAEARLVEVLAGAIRWQLTRALDPAYEPEPDWTVEQVAAMRAELDGLVGVEVAK